MTTKNPTQLTSLGLLARLRNMMQKILLRDPRKETTETIQEFLEDVKTAQELSEEVKSIADKPLGTFDLGALYVFEEMDEGITTQAMFIPPPGTGGSPTGPVQTVTGPGFPGSHVLKMRRCTFLITSEPRLDSQVIPGVERPQGIAAVPPFAQTGTQLTFPQTQSAGYAKDPDYIHHKWVQDAWNLTLQRPERLDLNSQIMWWGKWFRVKDNAGTPDCPDKDSLEPVEFCAKATIFDPSSYNNPL